jgi:hypothetical protein
VSGRLREIPGWAVAAVAAVVSLALVGAGQPAEPAPSSSGLARRPTPVFPEKAECATWLKPLPTHRKMGGVYHTVRVGRFDISGVSTRPSLDPPVGYAVARVPMSSGADGTIGAVLLAGQWLVPWNSVLDDATLKTWDESGVLKFDQHPDIGFTVRSAIDTRELSKSQTSSSYSCAVIADVTINGVTTEVFVPRVMLTLTRSEVRQEGETLKGDLLSIRARWKVRLSDFLDMKSGAPIVDANIEMTCSTVAPEFQSGEKSVPPDDSPASDAK